MINPHDRFSAETLDLEGAPPQVGIDLEELNRFYDEQVARQEHDRMCRIAWAELNDEEPLVTVDLY